MGSDIGLGHAFADFLLEITLEDRDFRQRLLKEMYGEKIIRTEALSEASI